MEYILKTNGVSKRYKNRWVLRDVNMGIRRGDIYGFVGENGGKNILDKSAVTVSGSVLKSFKAAASGDVIAVYGDFSDYRVNFQTNIIIDRHFDYDKRQWVVDVVAYVDGKVVDPFGFIVIKKA